MSHREQMSSVDTTWLRMDRPQNLMLIVAVWMLEGPVALDRLENQLAERQLTYRRYRQKVEFASGAPCWRDDPHFDLARRHLPLGKRNSMVDTNWYRCNSAAVGGRND